MVAKERPSTDRQVIGHWWSRSDNPPSPRGYGGQADNRSRRSGRVVEVFSFQCSVFSGKRSRFFSFLNTDLSAVALAKAEHWILNTVFLLALIALFAPRAEAGWSPRELPVYVATMSDDMYADYGPGEVNIAEGAVVADADLPTVIEVGQRFEAVTMLGHRLEFVRDSFRGGTVEFPQVTERALLDQDAKSHLRNSAIADSRLTYCPSFRARLMRALIGSLSSRPKSGSTISINKDRMPCTSCWILRTSRSNVAVAFTSHLIVRSAPARVVPSRYQVISV